MLLNHKKIGNYTFCWGCGARIPHDASRYCKSCEKENEKKNKKRHKKRVMKEDRQKMEIEQNPPHACTCAPQMLKGGKTLFSQQYLYGYYCRIDKRTGMSVCKRCGGIPPQGSVTLIVTKEHR
jgi:predicted nucleic acid-binding Zn ribbon protein